MIRCAVVTERWPLRDPFVIARETMTQVDVVVVTLADDDGYVGRGEAAGVDYDGETPATMQAAVDALGPVLDDRLTADDLHDRLPAGGARNALDCALWDLRAKRSGTSVAALAGLAPLRPLETVVTIGLADTATIARQARAARGFPTIKVKADATRHVDVVRAVGRESGVRRLIVDANQSWSAALLDELAPQLHALGVVLIEQPLPRDADAALADHRGPVPLAADESCTDSASLARLRDLYDVVNLKLDKCGGLTEALRMLDVARDLGLECMVGNMCGSSLAMAPAFVVGQRCRFVDLDGPLLQRSDRPHAMHYDDHGTVSPPSSRLWG